MKPDPAAPAEPLHLLRQQLILAQVRIMELEDDRDELAPKMKDLEALLGSAQTLADAKVTEAAHLTQVLASLQAEFAHLRHMQHVTNEALNGARADLAQANAGRAAAEQQTRQHGEELARLQEQTNQLSRRSEQLAVECAEITSLATQRLARINQLEAEAQAMKTSRSWRWTRWLRSLERSVGRNNRP